MNKIEKQILVNQLAMMRALRGTFNHDELNEKEAFTLNLLHPIEKPKTSVEKMQESTEESFKEYEDKFLDLFRKKDQAH